MKKTIGTIVLYAITTSFLMASDANSVKPEDSFKALDFNQDLILRVEEAANDVTLFNIFAEADSDQQVSRSEYNDFLKNQSISHRCSRIILRLAVSCPYSCIR